LVADLDMPVTPDPLGDRPFGSEKLAKLLRPYPSTHKLAYRVSALVNNPKNDVPQCVEAIR
jgi:hypothetical protein